MFRKTLYGKDMTFAEKLLALAHAHRIRYEELGAIVGASKGSVDRWVNRGVSPRLDQVVTYARHFNVPVAYLADDAQDEPEPTPAGLPRDEELLLEIFRGLEISPAEAIRRLYADGGRRPMVIPPDHTTEAPAGPLAAEPPPTPRSVPASGPKRASR